MRSPFIIVSLFALVACDPIGPGATGSVDLDPSVDTTGMAFLTIVAHSDADGVFQPADVMLQVDRPHSEVLGTRVALDEVTFPHEFILESGIGATDIRSWRVTAWLDGDAAIDRWQDDLAPAAGMPWGSTPFNVSNCGLVGYCDVTPGVEVTIDALF